jgi:outer membrane lipoprotein-sorting protein
MRWSYEEPEPSLVVSDGRMLSLYDPARGELQRLPVGEGFLSGAAIQFLLGEGDLKREFEVSALACEADAFELELVPRKPATYERLNLRIDAVSGDVVRTVIVDLLGNRTEVEFEAIEVDFGPGPELFQLVPPEGTRVIDLVGPGPEG